MRPLSAALLALLLAVPTAVAWSPWGVTVHVAPYHVGDSFETRWANSFPQNGKQVHHTGTNVAQIDGLGKALDAFGIERPTVDVRYDSRLDGQIVGQQVCHLLEDGNQTVRTEVISGTNGYGGTWQGPSQVSLAGLSAESTKLTAQPLAYFWGGCPMDLVGRTAIKEGERVPIREIVSDSDLRGLASPGLSDPARATTFHGRNAFELSWRIQDLRPDGDTGIVGFTFADGLPGIVSGFQNIVDHDGTSTHYDTELVGFHAGAGAPLSVLHGATLPTIDPIATFTPVDATHAPLNTLGLPYPMSDALADARANSMTISKFMDAHPDFTISNAYYDRRQTLHDVQVGPTMYDARTDGTWWLTIGDRTAGHSFGVSRSYPEPTDAPALPVATPPQIGLFDQGVSKSATYARDQLPATTIDAATLLRAATREGLHADRIETLWMGLFLNGASANRYYAISEVSTNSPASTGGAREGLNVNVDGQTGGVTNVYLMGKTSQQHGIVVSPSAGGLDNERVSTLSAIAGPGASGLAGGAVVVTGAALLLVALKFLVVPLFTRLRRDKLLDNPVRARLYERVRAEPGIHVAELIDIAGIGEGATRHHLQQLADHGFLFALEEPGFVRYFAAGEVPREVARKFAALRGGSMQKVFDAYVEAPDMTLREAAKKIGMSAPGVYRCRRKLLDEGLLPAR